MVKVYFCEATNALWIIRKGLYFDFGFYGESDGENCFFTEEQVNNNFTYIGQFRKGEE